MTISLSSTCSFFDFIREVIQKTTTFQIIHWSYSQQFDDIFYKEIAKKYEKYELTFII